MQVGIHAKNIQHTEDLENRFQSILQKLDRFLTEECRLHIRVRQESEQIVCEVMMSHFNTHFKAQGTSDIVEDACAIAVDKLYRQLDKARGRHKGHSLGRRGVRVKSA